MTSFESKADKGEASRTPIDPTITGMRLRPKPTKRLGGSLEISERMQEKTSGDPVTEDLEIVRHESRRVDDSQRNTICATTIDEPSNIYLRYRQPGLTKRAEGHLMILVDKVVNKTITDLHISYEEQTTTPQTRRLDQRKIQAKALVAVTGRNCGWTVVH